MPETPNQHPGVRVAFEDELCAGATMKCLDARMMQIYVHMASNDALTPEELLRRKGYLVGDTLTKGGVLLFAKDPARFIPCARVHIARFKQFERGGHKESICVKDLLLDGPLPKLLARTEEQVLDLTDEITFFDTDGGFKKVRDYPRHAWIDGLLGALLHRSYRSDSYIHITILEDRLQILSPGTPDVPIDRGARTAEGSMRNPRITRGMTEMGIAMEHIESSTSLQERLTSLERPVFEERDALDGSSVQLTVKSNIEAWNQRLEENMVDGRMLLSPIYSL